MPHTYRHQPIKAVYLTFQLIWGVFVSVPYWIVTNIPRSQRPRRNWSLTRVVAVNVVRRAMNCFAQAGPPIKSPDHLAITPGPGRKITGVWVQPVAHLITGKVKQWADEADITYVQLPGYWTHKKASTIDFAAPALPNEKVVLQFHGGGYIRLSAHPDDPTANIVRGYLQEIDTIERVFSLEYRLTSSKPYPVAHPFPTQLIDGLAGYNYLVNELGFAPENIILSGDSAGGNLAHALTRYLTESQDLNIQGMPKPPGGLILLSPWIDLGSTHEALENGSARRFLNSDYIGQPGGDVVWAKQSLCGPHDIEILETNPYISPASLHPDLVIDFKKFPKTFIVAGGAEVLYDMIVTLKNRMVADIGDKVTYFEAPDGIHDYLIFNFHEPERTDTLKAINEWFKLL